MIVWHSGGMKEQNMKTEIFGTLGPSCSDTKTLKKMFENGMTGMRLNLSHTSLRESEEILSHFHEAAADAGVKADLLIDMQGPELRVGHFSGERLLKEGDCVILTEEADDLSDVPAGAQALPVPDGFLRHLDDGNEILLDDGKLLLRTEEAGAESAVCRILRGGGLTARKSIKIVDKPVYGPALTGQDLMNLRDARRYGVTSVMQPFVRGKDDLQALRRALEECGAQDLRVFAKIENRQGIAQLENILEEADLLVIARGDLGNDLPLWELPAAQKEIEAVCRKNKAPFLVVTQMLTSMIHSAVPTRAEVSDIFNAVADGAAAVMVTNETAVGEYPAEVIRYLANTAAEAEKFKNKQ